MDNGLRKAVIRKYSEISSKLNLEVMVKRMNAEALTNALVPISFHAITIVTFSLCAALALYG